jgi:hypothetical protein
MKLTIQGIEIETEGAIAIEVSECGKRVKVTAAPPVPAQHHYHYAHNPLPNVYGGTVCGSALSGSAGSLSGNASYPGNIGNASDLLATQPGTR